MSRLLCVEAAGCTKINPHRDINQDVVTLRPDLGLYFVVDGMGGDRAGERTAAIAAASIVRFYENRGAASTAPGRGLPGDPRAFLVTALEHANHALLARAERDVDERRLGAAVAALHVHDSGFCIAHLGHVRGYRFRDGRLERLTEDHTRLNEYLWRGVPIDLAETRPDSRTLSRALGRKAKYHADIRDDDAKPSDVVLLCSNGLHSALSELQIARVLARRSAIEEMAATLLAEAQARGAANDATCVVLRWGRAATGDDARSECGARGRDEDPFTPCSFASATRANL